jgi:hypothetical protein
MLMCAVAPQIAACGFKKHGSREFEKRYEWGRAAIHFSFIEHDHDFDVTVDVGIRFDAVEDLVHRNNKLLTAKEKTNTFSMGAEIGNLTDGKPIRWTVASQAGVGHVAAEISGRIASTAIPYVERYGNMNRAIEVLSSDDDTAWIHSPIHGERAKRAVALALLLRDDRRANCLILSKSAFLRDRKDFGIADFEAFVGSLRKF